MRRFPVALGILGALALVLAGCSSPSGEGPAGTSGVPADLGGPWMALTEACGTCEWVPEAPEVETLVVYDSGYTLWYRFGVDLEQEGPGVSTEPGAAAWAAEIEAVAALLENTHTKDRHIHVHEVATKRLNSQEWGRMEPILESYQAAVSDPGEPNYECADCQGPVVELLADKRLVAELWPSDAEQPGAGNYEAGDEWDDLLQQLQAIGRWIHT